jgi:hypothetical protein
MKLTKNNMKLKKTKNNMKLKKTKNNMKLKKTKNNSKKKSKKPLTKKKSKYIGGRYTKYNSKKNKKVKKGGVVDAARYMVKHKNKTPKKSSSKSLSKHSSPKPVATLFSRPKIKDDYYKKTHKSRTTGNPVDNPGNRRLLDLENQDILNLIGRETNKIRERKRLEEYEKQQKEDELKRQMSYEAKQWHTPRCTCDVDGPPGMGTCPECGAYNAY